MERYTIIGRIGKQEINHLELEEYTDIEIHNQCWVNLGCSETQEKKAKKEVLNKMFRIWQRDNGPVMAYPTAVCIARIQELLNKYFAFHSPEQRFAVNSAIVNISMFLGYEKEGCLKIPQSASEISFRRTFDTHLIENQGMIKEFVFALLRLVLERPIAEICDRFAEEWLH